MVSSVALWHLLHYTDPEQYGKEMGELMQAAQAAVAAAAPTPAGAGAADPTAPPGAGSARAVRFHDRVPTNVELNDEVAARRAGQPLKLNPNPQQKYWFDPIPPRTSVQAERRR